jgi:hypothetical protein
MVSISGDRKSAYELVIAVKRSGKKLPDASFSKRFAIGQLWHSGFVGKANIFTGRQTPNGIREVCRGKL